MALTVLGGMDNFMQVWMPYFYIYLTGFYKNWNVWKLSIEIATHV